MIVVRFLAASLILALAAGCGSTVSEMRSSAPIDSAKFKGDYKKIMECATSKMPGPNLTPLYFEQERRATLTVVSQGEFNRTRGLIEMVVQQIADNLVQYEMRIGQGVYPTREGTLATRKLFADCSEGVAA